MISRDVYIDITNDTKITYYFRLPSTKEDGSGNSINNITITIQPSHNRVSFFMNGMSTQLFNNIIDLGYKVKSDFQPDTQKYYFHSVYFNIEEMHPWRFGTGLSMWFDKPCMTAFAETGITAYGKVDDLGACIKFISQTLSLLTKVNTLAHEYNELFAKQLNQDENILQFNKNTHAIALRK